MASLGVGIILVARFWVEVEWPCTSSCVPEPIADLKWLFVIVPQQPSSVN